MHAIAFSGGAGKPVDTPREEYVGRAAVRFPWRPSAVGPVPGEPGARRSCCHTDFVAVGYRRFLEPRLRETFGFEGSPIRINVRVGAKREGKPR